MGAIPDYPTYRDRREKATFQEAQAIASFAPTLSRPNSLFVAAGGVAPTAAAAPARTIAGAMGQANPNSGTQRYVVKVGVSQQSPMVLTLCDRLSHQGGLSAVTTGAQTTNLPTAALTRNTNGVGVQAGLEIYTQIGASAVTITASYTNDAGTPGQTTQAIAWGGTNNRENNRILPLPLAVGDEGVRSVESVTNSLSTGTIGNFGVTLYRPIFSVRLDGFRGYDVDPLLDLGWVPEIPTDACLFWICSMPALYSSTGGTMIELGLDER